MSLRNITAGEYTVRLMAELKRVLQPDIRKKSGKRSCRKYFSNMLWEIKRESPTSQLPGILQLHSIYIFSNPVKGGISSCISPADSTAFQIGFQYWNGCCHWRGLWGIVILHDISDCISQGYISCIYDFNRRDVYSCQADRCSSNQRCATACCRYFLLCVQSDCCNCDGIH